MVIRALSILALTGSFLFASTGAGSLLGLDYSKSLGFTNSLSVATDASGDLYIGGGPDNSGPQDLTKVSPDGTVLWSKTAYGPPFAVDATGNVYAANVGRLTKLSADGSRIEWTFDTGFLVIDAVAVDAASRVYIIGTIDPSAGAFHTTPNAFQKTPPATNDRPAAVARLNIAGTAFDYATYLTGSDNDTPVAIAVDGQGSAVIAGGTDSPDFPSTVGTFGSATAFLAKLSPDGSSLVYSVPAPGDGLIPSLSVGQNGDAALLEDRTILARYTAQGDLASTVALGVNRFDRTSLALDPSGNAYVAAGAPLGSNQVKNNLATCSPSYLSVFDPSGDLLQATWLPDSGEPAGIAVTGDSRVYVVGNNVTRLSPNVGAKTLPLACITDPANFVAGATAPGKIMTLWGEGIGPPGGLNPGVTLASGFPLQFDGVTVTFDGVPAPILYASDSQINLVAPWALASGKASHVCLTYNNLQANCLDTPVTVAAPTIFLTADGYAAAVNQDGTLNSATNPAKVGSYVSLFGTGFGPVSPAPRDGALVQLPLPVNVYPAAGDTWQIVDPLHKFTVEYSVPLQYAGPAPYEVYGVTQINVQTNSDMAATSLAIGVSAPVFQNSSGSGDVRIHIAN